MQSMFHRPLHPLQAVNSNPSASSSSSSSSAASSHPSTRTPLPTAIPTSSMCVCRRRAYDKKVGLGLSSSLPIRAAAGGEMPFDEEMKEAATEVTTAITSSAKETLITGLTTEPMKPSEYRIKLFIETQSYLGTVDVSVSESELKDASQPSLKIVQTVKRTIGQHATIASQGLNYFFPTLGRGLKYWHQIYSNETMLNKLRTNGFIGFTCIPVSDGSDVTISKPQREVGDTYKHVHAGVNLHGSVSPPVSTLAHNSTMVISDSDEEDDEESDSQVLLPSPSAASTTTWTYLPLAESEEAIVDDALDFLAGIKCELPNRILTPQAKDALARYLRHYRCFRSGTKKYASRIYHVALAWWYVWFKFHNKCQFDGCRIEFDWSACDDELTTMNCFFEYHHAFNPVDYTIPGECKRRTVGCLILTAKSSSIVQLRYELDNCVPVHGFRLPEQDIYCHAAMHQAHIPGTGLKCHARGRPGIYKPVRCKNAPPNRSDECPWYPAPCNGHHIGDGCDEYYKTNNSNHPVHQSHQKWLSYWWRQAHEEHEQFTASRKLAKEAAEQVEAAIELDED